MKPTIEALNNPFTASLFDARLTLDMILTGQHGDADPRHLIQGAQKALGEALAALEVVKA